jgi:hypothetical protein
VLGAAGAGAAVVALGSTRAAASTTTAPGATSTTLPTVVSGNYTLPALPNTPSPQDLLVLTFLDSLQLAVEALYEDADGGGDAEVLGALRDAHRQQGETFKGLAGVEATKVANRTLLEEYGSAVASDPLPTLAELEDRLIATFLDQLAVVTGTDAAAKIAGGLAASARIRVVLGQLMQEDLATSVPDFETKLNSFTMDDYPAERV